MALRRDKRDIYGTAPGKEWDPLIKLGSLVFLNSDSRSNIYIVTEFESRVVQSQDLYNSPSLLSKGLNAGDEIPPYVVVTKEFIAPSYDPCERGRKLVRKVDGTKVTRVTKDSIRYVVSNLEYLLSRVEE